MANHSIIEYLGESNDGKCGYCKTTGRYNSHGFWAHTLNVNDYQSLINRNWRRSGQYCYLPKNADTCCPMYTIKSDALNFKPSKSHKKILKRMNKFLRDGIKDKISSQPHHDEGSMEAQEPMPSKEPSNVEIHDINISSIQSKTYPKVNTSNKEIDPVPRQNKTALNESEKPSNPKKAKLIRLELKKEKLAAKGQTLSDVQPKQPANVEKSLEDFLAEEPTDGKHRLEVKLVPSTEGSDKNIFNLYKKYQVHVHGDLPESLNSRSYERFLVTSPLQVK